MGLVGIVGRGALAWAVTLGGLRAVVVQPEHCGQPSIATLTAAAEDAVGWFDANQRDDGTWLYRFDRATHSDVGGYNIVRHAGVTMSLQQAAGAGIAEAGDIADRGIGWAMQNLYSGPGFRALASPGSPVRVGATGLLVAALVERRDRSRDTRYDEVMHQLGAFLVAMTNERGQVYGTWDADAASPRPDSFSPYFTGEAFWALALLHRTFPGAGYDDPALRIARYLAEERDDVEGWWPGVADHWAAYGFAATTTWPERPVLTESELDYIRRQMGFQSMQIRWESQRTNSFVSHYTRGRQTLGAGLGTIGEALGQWTAMARVTPQFAAALDDLEERTRCAAGVIEARQVESDDPAENGAWFQFDVTQMDDQQHALSALLGALAVARGARA